MKLLTAVVITFFSLQMISVGHAQEIFQPGARSQSLGGVSVVLGDCWAVYGNQAGLAEVDHFEFGGSFQSRFLINELSLISFVGVVPTQKSVFGFSHYQFGSAPFRQTQTGFAFAHSLNPAIHLGVRFSYYQFLIFEDQRSVASAGIDLGAQYKISGQFILGFHFANPYQTKVKTYSNGLKLPSIVRVGVGQRFSDQFFVAAELENRFDRNLVARSGMEYSLKNRIFFRGGVSGRPLCISGGLGFRAAKLVFDLSTSYHQVLGNSPSVSFQYQIR